MAGGVSDIYFTSLRLAKGESVAEASPAPLVRAPGGAVVSGGDGRTGRESAVDGLTAGLVRRLAGFEKALARFVWPSGASLWENARLVVGDPGLDGRVAATTAAPGEAVNPFKYFSAGKTAIAASGVPAGDYAFTVAQGKTEETFDVAVGPTDAWGTVLGKVASAINASAGLSVRADVVRQRAPFELDPSLAAVGSLLALSVNPRRLAQDVTVADVSGDLLERLGLAAASSVAAPAQTGTLLVAAPELAQPTFIHSGAFDPNAPAGLSPGLHTFSAATGAGGQPVTYVSTAFDPDAATTLSPGAYRFGVSLGGQTRDLAVTVKAGWTWGDVQNAVAGQINATPSSTWKADGSGTELVGAAGFAIPGVEAATRAVSLPSATDPDAVTAGRVLSVSAAGSSGEALVLTDGSGGILTALGLTAPLRGTVVSVAVRPGDTWGEVLGRVSRDVGLATSRVSARSPERTMPSDAVPGLRLTTAGRTAELVLRDRRLGESLTLVDGATGFLAALGMNATLPGQDGEILVDGGPVSSENNAYALQSGRLNLSVEAQAAGPLPLTVTRNMEEIETRLGDVVGAYNDLRKYLSANRDFFDAALAGRLEAPVADNWPGLAGLGFSKTRGTGLLWISSDAFWRAIANDADAAGATLAGVPSGLVPAWKTVVADIGKAGAKSFLAPETAHLERIAPRRTAADLERKNWLVDLFG